MLMKKIFTLVATAIMALSVSAQDDASKIYDVTEVLKGATEITSVPNITVTYGGEVSTNKEGVEDATVWKELKKKGFKYEIYGETYNFTNYLNAQDNARIANFTVGGMAPIYGGFTKYVPTSDGLVVIYFYIPDGKDVIFSEISSANPNGINLLLGDEPKANIFIEDGTRVAVNETGVPQSNAKTVAVLTCNLKAGNTYYLSLNGSKLGVGGFIYLPDPNSNSSLTTIAAEENAPVEYFNLQGVRVANPANGLYIKRQGNKVEKVYVK